MKKFFIYLFLTLSVFLVASCFINKSNNKSNISFQFVLTEIKNSRIGFDFQNDIKEMGESINALNINNSLKTGNVLDVLTGIGKTIYYGVRFLIKCVIHTLVASLNIIILIGRCIGLTNIGYIRLTSGSSSMSDAIPSVFPGGTGQPPNPFDAIFG